MLRTGRWLVLSLGLLGCRRTPPPTAMQAAPPVIVATPPPPKTIALERETETRESQGLVLARLGGKRTAFVADEDDDAVIEIDLETQALHSHPLGTRPRDLLILADGTLAATLPEGNAVVVLAREESGALREERRVSLPAEPMALGLSPDDARLFVTTGASHSLVELDAKLAERGRWSIAREPRAVLVSRDGARVFVSHAAENVLTVLRNGAIEAKPITNGTDCGEGKACPSRRVARHADALVRIGERGIILPASQVLPNPPSDFGITAEPFDDFGQLGSPQAQGPSGYGIGPSGSPPMFMDVSTFDEQNLEQIGSGTMVFEGTDCLLPRAAVAAADFVIVACQGSGRIEQHRNPHGMHSPATIATRTAVPAGPSALAVDRENQKILVWSTFARALSAYELAANLPLKPAKHPMPPQRGLAPRPTSTIEVPRVVARAATWLRGRELFYTNGDARISGDGRACASCHIEGRDDGLAWDTPNGKRRTRLIAGQLAQAPYGWLGEHATLEDHVRVTFKQLRGRGLVGEDFDALLGYVRALPKPPAQAVAQAEGKRIFEAAECGNCHGSGGSDRSTHDVGTGGNFMTPTLAGISTRRQMMHDGRYATLDQLLVGAKAMGTGSSLSEPDRKALIGYLETL